MRFVVRAEEINMVKGKLITGIAFAAMALPLGACDVTPVDRSTTIHPQPAMTALTARDDYEGTKFDGTYIGTPYTTAGGCYDIHREMVIVVQRSHASLVWNYRDGYMLLGEVSPVGAVDMHSQHETFLVDLKGQIEGGTLTATTSSTSSHGDCAYAMTMTKRDLAQAR
jgi:hypothetical protein